jgi:adenosylcobinamide-GDP ribazoletransferase
MKSFWTAIRFLTFFRRPEATKITSEEIGKSTSFFPLVGFSMGLVLVLLNWLLDPYLASEIVSVLLVAALMLMTRAQHLTGLKNSFDGLGVERDRGIGINGLLAVLVTVALKFRAVEVMGDARSEGLLLAPVLGRWAMVIFAYGSDLANGGTEQIGAQHIRGSHLLLATVTALLLVIAFASRIGLWIALWISLLTLLSRSYLHRRTGGVTVDHFGAVGEISETLTLVFLASL